VLNVSSTGCNNERQLFAKLTYSAIDNVLTNLLPAGLHDFFQVLNVSNATTTVNKLLKCSPDGIVYWVAVVWGYSVAIPIRFQLASHELMLHHHLSTDAFSYLHSTTSAMTSYKILISAEKFKCTFLFCFLICLCAASVKGVILCKFS